MHKITLPVIGLILAASAVPTLLSAQGESGKPAAFSLGRVSLDYKKPATYRPGFAQFAGQVRMTSENYDLSCETLMFLFDKTKGNAAGKTPLNKVDAEGDPAAGVQVIADVRRPLESQAYHIFADHAVYVPDKSRPNGITMSFTGHVKVITTSGFLAGPSETTTDHATLLLGQGDDYPRLDTGPGHITFTPAQ